MKIKWICPACNEEVEYETKQELQLDVSEDDWQSSSIDFECPKCFKRHSFSAD